MTAHRCVILQPIAPAGIERLRTAGLAIDIAADTRFATLKPFLANATAVITRNHGLSEQEAEAAPHLRVVGVHGTGTDKVARAALAARGITLVNTPGANAQSVAELTLALMLACARGLVEADRAARRGDNAFRQTHRTSELAGRRLGLAGFGHIARLVGRFGQALGMEVAVLSAHAPPATLAAERMRAFPDIDSLCEWADVLSLHGVPASEPLIGKRQLALLGGSGILINTARGALVDERALAASLKDGTIAAAGLDVLTREPIVPDDPLLSCPNLVITPHIGGSTENALERTGRQVAERVVEALQQLGLVAHGKG